MSKTKAEQSKGLGDQVADFLKNGGEIKKIPTGVSSDDSKFNRTPKTKSYGFYKQKIILSQK
tara:strand:+ start:706 stop:891 length:186 start_codon:yes stop_codon:yes gene_type:complete